jgi:hypothetical protein
MGLHAKSAVMAKVTSVTLVKTLPFLVIFAASCHFLRPANLQAAKTRPSPSS